jgi:hypothetical protein
MENEAGLTTAVGQISKLFSFLKKKLYIAIYFLDLGGF